MRDNQALFLEDLCVRGLARTRLAKSVHDASWGTFRRMLEEKAARYGRHVGIVGRFVPTSQTCHACWTVDGPKPLQRSDLGVYSASSAIATAKSIP
ncbi:zinc ribbon domain-containing protein [Embleya sp. AB8]|uniref:zinc ribbon domain-containing protein n=1 Tax=Embleya sp. AB8 TaxID=3156304 RepID=UPI003C7772D6